MANTVLGIAAGKQERKTVFMFSRQMLYSFDKKTYMCIYFYDYSIIILFYLKLKRRKYTFSN